MSERKRTLLGASVLLAAAAGALPAVAGSESTPSIAAVNSGGGYSSETHKWSPSEVTISPGGSVTIANSTTVSHGVRFVSGPTPACSGVPGTAGEPSASTSWSGSCTFSQAGTYTFYCTVHGSEMTATVTVASSGTTPGTTPGTPTPSAPRPSPGGAAPPVAGGGSGGDGAAPGAASSPLEGRAASAVKLASGQRGRVVRGSVAVSTSGAGGRLEVELLAARAALASSAPRAAGAAAVRVGRLVRSALPGGRARFAVPLSARGRGALARKGRLRLTVAIVLRGLAGAPVTVRRAVLLRA